MRQGTVKLWSKVVNDMTNDDIIEAHSFQLYTQFVQLTKTFVAKMSRVRLPLNISATSKLKSQHQIRRMTNDEWLKTL